MPLKKKPVRTKRPLAASFRLSEEAIVQLRTLSSAFKLTQVEVIEALLAEEFNRAMKENRIEMQRAKRDHGR